MGQFAGPTDPATDARWPGHQHRKGFFTDTSICIGCKACEVACKEWNQLPRDGDLELLESSYDNTGQLGASTWRHVAFVEQGPERIRQARASGRALVDLGMPTVGPPSAQGPESPTPKGPELVEGLESGPSTGSGPLTGSGPSTGSGPLTGSGPSTSSGPLVADPATGSVSLIDPSTGSGPAGAPDTPEFRWLMASDVCKHCTHAGCLDVCPTGALFRSEFGTVVVQPDVCNGCGACVAGCPFGVIERRTDGTVQPGEKRGERKGERPEVSRVGVAQKCTLCYDRLVDDQTPACAQTCPTTSIKFGDRDEMLATAKERVAELHAQGMTEARLYGANDLDGVGGTGSIFLLLDEPETYGLPPDPRVPTADLPQMFKRAGLAAAGMIAATAIAFLGRKNR